ncbi:hypothetical protein Pla123a_28010 [Posidoniimonas polymericola]|uniref:DUF1795 domain-containing protein n=1 Tax=Posidoniimonas polymericola TaxID=2528002 RepID=A0A5C5YME1_9BACT|nr:hypothetical protein [Posidoniimonas polymericola]TWT76015.1 hypothetical protein Pla123a_28010 [Posidoniimonas polymericola]
MTRPALPLSATLSLALLAVLAGCQPADEIRTYTVPKERSAPAAQSAPPAQATPSRMIAAMLEGEQRAWFFKVMGPVESVDQVADSVKQFLNSVAFDEQAGRPVWETPAGWTERPASQMRLATLVIPTSGQPVELSVIGLGLADDWDASVLDNVNRWRGQLGLEPIAAGDAEQLESIKLGDRRAVIVDLSGEAEASAMMPPMAGGMPGAASTPPMASAPPSGLSKPLVHELPDGWREVAPTSMRVVNLRVGEGESEAEVTGMAFPAGAPDIASVLSNANRWLGENSMSPVTEEGLDAITDSIRLDEQDATYFELLSDDHEKNTLAAMVERGPMVWFFKLRGPAATVSGNRDTFRQWLSTVHFNVP